MPELDHGSSQSSEKVSHLPTVKAKILRIDFKAQHDLDPIPLQYLIKPGTRSLFEKVCNLCVLQQHVKIAPPRLPIFIYNIYYIKIVCCIYNYIYIFIIFCQYIYIVYKCYIFIYLNKKLF